VPSTLKEKTTLLDGFSLAPQTGLEPVTLIKVVGLLPQSSFYRDEKLIHRINFSATDDSRSGC
jgi:hypothetical protein